MTIDDTEAVMQRFGRVSPVDPDDLQFALDYTARLKDEFQEGDTLYHYSTCEALAGDFGYLRVRGREIVDAYFVGMS